MKNTRNTGSLIDALETLGEQCVAAFINGMQTAYRKADVVTGQKRVKANSVIEPDHYALERIKNRCMVPKCKRKAAAKGCCNNHYSKAHRLGIDLDKKINATNLKTLAADGRSVELHVIKGGLGAKKKRTKVDPNTVAAK